MDNYTCPLTLDLLFRIALTTAPDVTTWRALLAIPSFARATLGKYKDHRTAFLVKTVEGRTTTYTVAGRLHNFDDKPAYRDDIEFRWYHCGKLHRDNSPAIVYLIPGGSCYYYTNGQYIPHQNRSISKVSYLKCNEPRWLLYDYSI